MSYKAKYMKARDRYYEHTTKNEELKSQLSVVSHDVQELREEIKMLINTILGAAPEFEPSLTSDDAAEEEALDQVLNEFHYGRNAGKTNREEAIEAEEESDNPYYTHHRGDDMEARGNRSINNETSSPPQYRQRVRQPISNTSHRSHRTSATTNGRHSSSRSKYEEVAADPNLDDQSSRSYADNVGHSPYSGSAPGDDLEPEGDYYSGEGHARGNPSSSSSQRFRNSSAINQRTREEEHHPYSTSSRHRSSGNGHHRSAAKNNELASLSPEPRYSNSSHNYSSRAYRN